METELKVTLHPKADITAYELALLLPYMPFQDHAIMTRKRLELLCNQCPYIDRHLYIEE